MRHDMAGGKARCKPFKVGKEVHTALSLLEIGVHGGIDVHGGGVHGGGVHGGGVHGVVFTGWCSQGGVHRVMFTG